MVIKNEMNLANVQVGLEGFDKANSLSQHILPDSAYFSDARFIQSGDDLILRLPNGESHVVEGYFALTMPPVLEGTFGGKLFVLNPELIMSFLERPVQLAQVGDSTGDVIGSIEVADGEVVAVALDGSRRTLEVGSPLLKGEVLETGTGASVKVVMLDETLFSLGANARMAVNDLVFNADTGEGESSYSILKGSFLFVSGLIAKNDPTDMNVNTPIGTIGIRGTIVSGEIQSDDGPVFRITVVDGAVEIESPEGDIFNLDGNFASLIQENTQDEIQEFTSSLTEILSENSETFATLNSQEVERIGNDIAQSLSESSGSAVEIKINLDAEGSSKVEVVSEDSSVQRLIEGETPNTPVPENPIPIPVVNPTPTPAPLLTPETPTQAPVVGADEPVDVAEAGLLEDEVEDEIEEDNEVIILDTEAPSAPSLSLADDNGMADDSITNNGKVIVEGLEDNAVREYSTDGGKNWTVFTGDSFTLTGDGDKSVQVRQTDVAGNVSESSKALTFNLDSTVPSAPSLSLADDNGMAEDIVTNNGKVTVEGLEDNAVREYSADSGENWTVFTGDSFTLTGDGDKSVQVRQTDMAGNVTSSSLSFTLDATAPSAASLVLETDSGASNDNITNDGTVLVTGLEAGATHEYSTDGETWLSLTDSGIPTLTDDGDKSVQVRQTDMAGNVTSSSLSFTLDATAPSAASLVLETDSGVSNDGITNDGTVLVTGLEAGATHEYSTDGETWLSLTDSGIPTLTGDGDKTVQVRQTDVAGNISESSKALTFNLDSTVPSAPSLSLADDNGMAEDIVTNNGKVTVEGLEDKAVREYSTDDGENWTVFTGDSFTLTGDGDKSVQVRQTDVAGNVSESSKALTFNLDSTVPSAPSLSLANDSGTVDDSITNNGTVTVTNLEAGSVREYSTDDGENWTVFTGDSFTLTGDGDKSVQVRQTDVAGNVSESSKALTFNLDSTVPSAPSLSLANDSGTADDSITNNGKVTVEGLEDNAVREYSADDGESWTVFTGDSFTLTGDGDKSVQVRQTDIAGNVSESSKALTFNLDSTVPSAPSLSLADDNGMAEDIVTNNGKVTVEGLEDNAVREYSADDGKSWTVFTGDSFTLTGDGDKSVQVRQTDIAGNVSESSKALTFNLDSTVPSAPSLSLADDNGMAEDIVTNNGKVTVEGLEDNAVREYSTDSGKSWTVFTGDSFTLTGDGDKSVQVRQTDVAGNVSESSKALTFNLDSTAPSAPSLSLANDNGMAEDIVTNNGTVTVTNLEAESVREYSTDGGKSWKGFDGDSFTLTGDGAKTVQVRQTDLAGNVTSSSLSFTLDTTAPTTTITGSGKITPNTETDSNTNTITITFSEAIDPNSFTESDITVANGTLVAGSLSKVSDMVYTATVTPSAAGENGHNNVAITLAAGSVQDTAGNDSTEVKNSTTLASFNWDGSTDLTGWDTSHVTNARWTFSDNNTFNQDIGGWDVSNVTDMSFMFYNAIVFNQDLDDWNVSNVTDMGNMFRNANAFNQDIGSWNVSNVTDMKWMFGAAKVFDENISGWDVSNVTDMTGMFDYSSMSIENIDATLLGWARQEIGEAALKNNVVLGLENVTYSNATAYQYLIDTYQWVLGGTLSRSDNSTGNAGENEVGISSGTYHGLGGNDVLYSQNYGNITVVGGAGDDHITLGTRDYQDTVKYYFKNAGNDIIYNFTLGDVESIQRADIIDLSEMLVGYQPSLFSDFITAEADGGNTKITIDYDGLGGSEDKVEITLNGVSYTKTLIAEMISDGNLKVPDNSGDDTIYVNKALLQDLHDNPSKSVDGGEGIDTLYIAEDMISNDVILNDLDQVQNFEKIDVTNITATIDFDRETVKGIVDPADSEGVYRLTIDANGGDAVNGGDTFNLSGFTKNDDEGSYSIYTAGNAELAISKEAMVNLVP